MDPSNPLYVHPSDGPGSLPIQEKLIGAQNYRSWRRAMEIGLSTKRKLGFVRVSDSIAKSIMFIESASEIWIQLETRFSLSNGSRKYKLSKECFEIQQQGSTVSEYYTRMKCVWEELDSMLMLPRLVTITPEISNFLSAVEKQKEEQRLFQFLNGLDDCYGAQRSQLLLLNPLPSVENACAVIQQEESQKDVFKGGVTIVESAALFSKQETKGKCSICGYKWHPPDKCWEKVGYPVWHHKHKQSQGQNKFSQSQYKPKSSNNGGANNGGGSTFKRTAANVTSGASSFTFTSEQFETLMRGVLNDMKNSGTSGADCTDDELEFVAGSLPIQEKLIGAQNYRSWRRAMEIGLSTKRKLGWIMSSVSDSIAKSIMFIESASEIWIQLETRFSLSNGSRKYKLSKECFEIQQQGSTVSEYYTRMKCVWEELDSMLMLPRLVTITPEISNFLSAVEKQKEEQAGLPIILKQANVFEKKGINPTTYAITFKNAKNVSEQGGLFGDCSIWVCIFLYRLAHGKSLDVHNHVQAALAYREHLARFFLNTKFLVGKRVEYGCCSCNKLYHEINIFCYC
ncbi:hypothetical protein CTI12_AA239180 [Artemisia annua]|uniref:Retrotransposon Copia-like N-terminal domain-containing protein n=1 Tax=Artemisia annua TaxID=35608 RepID=A0A2U1N2V9_ARTAN|nr:hypothetical protein CTI12_AA239180 [Artemisia annua]